MAAPMLVRKCSISPSSISMRCFSSYKNIVLGSINSCARNVTTWSPLASTFNARQNQKPNFSFMKENSGLFGVPELKDYTGFYLIKERATNRAAKLVEETTNLARNRPMVAIFDDLSDTLCQVADLAEFIRVAHSDAKFSQAAEEASQSINALVERLNTNRDLYTALQNVVQNGDILPTDDVDSLVANLFLFDFEQCGIHLDKKKRDRVVHLNECILHTGSHFMQESLQPRVVPKNVLPEQIRHLFSRDGDNVVVSGLYADSSNELAREAAYKIYLYPDNQQERRLCDLLTSRAELARLCGFPSYAHRALRGSLAGNPETVRTFLELLSTKLQPKASRDFEDMKKLKQTLNPNSPQDVKPWDTPFLNSRARAEKYNIDSKEYIPYFSLGACMEGLNYLFGNLYDVTLEPKETEPGEVWAPDVHKLAVTHRLEGTLGYIYCDFLERPGKPNQDCHFTIRGGRDLADGSYQLPVVVLLLNFLPPTWTTPSLLTPGMVDNLFHEMGHAMHSMLGRTKYQHITGTRCSTDFAEVPSVLMEYFASDPRVLKTFARHYKTGNPIPYDLLERLCNSKHVFTASETQLQVFYAMLDQKFHDANIGDNFTSHRIIADVQNKYYGLPHVANTAWQHRFGHLVGYGAKYYSYLMSRAVASWIWHSAFQKDPFSSSTGSRYRKNLLAHGGGKPPKELVENFVNTAVTPAALADALVSEIEFRQSS